MGNEHFESHILSGVRCPTCKGRYSLLKFLGRKDDLYKVLVHCGVCDTYGIGTARIGEAATAVGETAGIRSRICAPPISADDVLEMHEFLRTFDGNFVRLFR
ncbi:MAG: hypothetical protein M1358_14090 [Chloroflexi bacterium]|nr:hypothetical protein [Chloroflexota bacterium]